MVRILLPHPIFLRGGFEQTTSTMETMIADFGKVATAIWDQTGTIADTILGNPLLLFTTGFLFVGGCIGIFGRLLSRR